MSSLRLAALAAFPLAALSCSSALASPADYDCDGGSTLTADFTPRSAQVRY